MKMSIVPNDLISTEEATRLIGFKDSNTVRYHIKQKHIRSFKNYRNRLFVSKAEVLQYFNVIQPADDRPF
jgi:hypothetical protein